MSLSCDRMSLLIPLYLDQEIDSKEQLELTEHLHYCQQCCQLLQSEFTFKNTLAQGLKPLQKQVPSRISYAIIHSLDKAQTSAKPFPFQISRFQFVWSAAIIGLGFFIFWIVQQNSPSLPSTPSSSIVAESDQPLEFFPNSETKPQNVFSNSFATTSKESSHIPRKLKISQEHLKFVKRIRKPHFPRHPEFIKQKNETKNEQELASEETFSSIPEVRLVSHRR